MTLACAQLTREQAAEVEARARATLLTSTAAVVRIAISCAQGEARIVVESSSDQATELVPLLAADVRTQLVDAVDRAIQTLSSRPSDSVAPSPAPEPTASVERPAPLPPPPATPAAKPPAPSPDPVSAAPTDSGGRSLHVSASALGELWSHGSALGGALGLGYGSRELELGLRLSALTSADSSSAFRASEYGVALGIGWVPGWSFGFRGSAALGPSLLSVSPRSDLTPLGDTSVAAWFVELGVARPFWFGAWSLTPELSARFFTAQREVTLDTTVLLVIPYVAPRLALTLVYAFE